MFDPGVALERAEVLYALLLNTLVDDALNDPDSFDIACARILAMSVVDALTDFSHLVD